MPWETKNNYNGFFQSPQKIIIEGSNGASEYGNKFGEPVIAGFFRAYGLLKYRIIWQYICLGESLLAELLLAELLLAESLLVRIIVSDYYFIFSKEAF